MTGIVDYTFFGFPISTLPWDWVELQAFILVSTFGAGWFLCRAIDLARYHIVLSLASWGLVNLLKIIPALFH